MTAAVGLVVMLVIVVACALMWVCAWHAGYERGRRDGVANCEVARRAQSLARR